MGPALPVHEFRNPSLDLLILRDPRESPRKCSLSPLLGTPGVRFVDYRAGRRMNAEGRILLHVDGAELRPADGDLGLLLIDCAWRKVDRLLASLDGEFHLRRLPVLHSAYPRKSRIFPDPVVGLSSIEALYAAQVLRAKNPQGILAHYHWREEFLRRNPELCPPSGSGRSW